MRRRSRWPVDLKLDKHAIESFSLFHGDSERPGNLDLSIIGVCTLLLGALSIFKTVRIP
jgi:hypothetical protein